ncbi:hypothetical protein HDV05_005163 [Chytridiales sp. JEL 0842]|nr:hypothetical protein HDV05_005163 [Chytridiales sp. JEL 0842]
MPQTTPTQIADRILEIASNHPNVRVVNRDSFKLKLEKMAATGGLDGLHIISDFDMTITKYWVNNQRSPSSHAVLTRSSIIPQDFKDRTDELYKKYYPIEVSATLPLAEKSKAMEDWWTKAHEMIASLGLKPEDLEKVVQETPVVLRSGVKEVVDLCQSKNVPLLVFSAGVYDVINTILKLHSLKPSTVHLISNRMRLNPTTGIYDAFVDPLIHVFNKNESSILSDPLHHPWASSVLSRPNVLLLGDSLGDVTMAEGVKHDTKLCIGFLNHDEERLGEAYEKVYDVLLLGDGGWEVIQQFLDCLGAAGGAQ